MSSTAVFKKAFVCVLILLLGFQLTGESFAYAYDLSYERAQHKSSGPVTVALVPFAEKRTPSLEGLMTRLAADLKKKNGFRVLDNSKMDAILQYYLRYVNQNAGDDSVQKALTEARQELLAGNYAATSRLLDGVEQKIRSRMSAGGGNEGLYQVHLLRAKVHHANGAEALVQRDYDQLVLVHPDLELDPNLYSHWERTALGKSQSKIANRRISSIEVKSSPEGSEVFLNGVHRGITPLVLQNLPAGTHVVEVKTVHYAPFLKQVVLREGDRQAVTASLARTDFEVPSEEVTIRPSLYQSELEVSRMISALGYHMGVDKIVLVADKNSAGQDSVVYRTGDARLGAVQKQYQFPLEPGGSGIPLMVSTLGREVKVDVLENPAKYADQTVGSLDLLHKKRKPFYKKPLFWILAAVAGGTGGALAAILGAGAAAAGGVVIGL